jgi:uncharacterized Tic20 family protein
MQYFSSTKFETNLSIERSFFSQLLRISSNIITGLSSNEAVLQKLNDLREKHLEVGCIHVWWLYKFGLSYVLGEGKKYLHFLLSTLLLCPIAFKNIFGWIWLRCLTLTCHKAWKMVQESVFTIFQILNLKLYLMPLKCVEFQL